MKQQGFTLIEIMVALLILSGLSVLIGQAVRSGLQNKSRVELQLEEESSVRDAIRIIDRDIQSAFHHRDSTVATYNKILELRKKQAQQKAQQGVQQPGSPPAPPPGAGAQPGVQTPGLQSPDPLASATPLPTPKQLTGFVGSKDSLLLTVQNHVRRFLDSKESDLAKVGYQLRSCRSETKAPGGKATSSQCLVRFESTLLDADFKSQDPKETDTVLVIASHVKKFELKYYKAGTADPVESWDSTNSVGKDLFPDAVSVVLETQDTNNPKSRKQILSTLSAIRFANNKDPDEDKSPTPAPATGAPVQSGGAGK